eukprot:4260708-Amphidinium_carterae.2
MRTSPWLGSRAIGFPGALAATCPASQRAGTTGSSENTYIQAAHHFAESTTSAWTFLSSDKEDSRVMASAASFCCLMTLVVLDS